MQNHPVPLPHDKKRLVQLTLRQLMLRTARYAENT